MEEQQGFPPGRAALIHESQPVATAGQVTVPSPGERQGRQQLLGEIWGCVEILPAEEQKLWRMGTRKKRCCELPGKERSCVIHRNRCIIL